MKRDVIPKETIKRMSLYLRCLNMFLDSGRENISSKDLADVLKVNASKIRKDLSYFGEFGTRGRGYDVRRLSGEIRSILHLDGDLKIVLIGVGNLGSALISYPKFGEQGFNIVAAFDKDPRKIGKRKNGILIQDLRFLKQEIKKKKIRVAILAVPTEEAQVMGEFLERAGIRAILNFAPCQLSVENKIKVAYVDLAMELGRLSYHVKNYN